jgi:hypothetical protein
VREVRNSTTLSNLVRAKLGLVVSRTKKKTKKKKTTARRQPAPRTVTTTVATPWERNAVVARATTKILKLERETAARVVDAVVEVGKLLAVVKDQLPRGEWLRWLEEGAHFDPRTAARYMAVEYWARTQPRDFARIRGVSISKVYLLLGLASDERRELIGRRVPIPETNLRLRIEEMTFAHLDRVIRDMRAVPPPVDPVPALLQTAHNRLDAFETLVDALIEHGARVEPTAAATLHRELAEITTRIAKAFGL